MVQPPRSGERMLLNMMIMVIFDDLSSQDQVGIDQWDEDDDDNGDSDDGNDDFLRLSRQRTSP